MTREEKIEILMGLSVEDLIDEFKTFIREYDKGPAYDMEKRENMNLAEAELKRRLSNNN